MDVKELITRARELALAKDATPGPCAPEMAEILGKLADVLEEEFLSRSARSVGG